MAESATDKQRRVWDRNAPGYDKQIAYFERVWFSGGRDWLCSRARGRTLEVAVGTGSWPPIFAAQWLLRQITKRAAGEHFTRRQLPLVKAAGFTIVETARLKAGSIERIHAVKPA